MAREMVTYDQIDWMEVKLQLTLLVQSPQKCTNIRGVLRYEPNIFVIQNIGIFVREAKR